jgi:putative glutamine amidotransferase
MRPLIGISSGFSDYGDYLGVAFSRPLEARGAVAVILPYAGRPQEVLGEVDGVLLAVGRDLEPHRYGGRPHPTSTLHSRRRDEAELALAPLAIAAGLPVLGICRGMQIINTALGGTLHADHSVLPGAAADHPGGDWARWERVVAARLKSAQGPPHPSHQIAIRSGSLLAAALGASATVNSYHHQSIDQLGVGVEVVARAPDGVIEAIEVPGAPEVCLGVQWELQEDPDSPLFDLLVERAHRASARRRIGQAPAPAVTGA